MRAIGVIPARWGSTRLEGKVLAPIAGKPMIQHVFERAKQSKKLDEVIIACDEENILQAALSFGAVAVLTSKDHPSGSDRIAEAVENKKVDIIVNIQGDEPLIHPQVIDALVEALENDVECRMATVIKAISGPWELDNPNVVKAVVDENRYAISFSRSAPVVKDAVVYKHLGIYAYRKDFLLKFRYLPKSVNEKRERLEQLRALEAGYRIKTVLTDIETVGVDTPEDLNRVREIMDQKIP